MPKCWRLKGKPMRNISRYGKKCGELQNVKANIDYLLGTSVEKKQL